jgi:hypothetical protein
MELSGTERVTIQHSYRWSWCGSDQDVRCTYSHASAIDSSPPLICDRLKLEVATITGGHCPMLLLSRHGLDGEKCNVDIHVQNVLWCW